MMTDVTWADRAAQLGPRFAERAAKHDETDAFVAENYRELKEHRFFSAGVPTDLGGGGAAHGELCAMLRTLGGFCPSTALALSMHTHQVCVAAWRWQRERAPVDGLLRRIATDELVLVTSGGSDWLPSSGRAERVEGGYRVTARKVFSSGSPGGSLLLTSAIFEENGERTVLHFPVPLDEPGVRMLDTWRTLGMRGTGSNDIALEGVFVPEGAIAGRREPNVWTPLFHLTALLAVPLIYAVYVGLAESARALALSLAARRREEPAVALLVGEMDNELTGARLALEHMIRLAAEAQPGPAATNEVVIGRTLAGRGAARAVDKAMEVAGGAGFYRAAGLERMFRDVQAARYHPLQEKAQLRFSGRYALGLDLNG
jgi:alkylation response protein AidB-like acyl-CoA dehydrogenase